VIPELERVIKEALMQDDRITNVKDFNFEKKGKDILVTFIVETVEGEVSIEKVVSVSSEY
jgi:hypothetical protein